MVVELSEFEQQLVDHVVNGTVLDLAPRLSDKSISEVVMRSWGSEHEIRSIVIRDILRGRYLPKDGPDPHGLQLRGARIVGRIDLDSLTTPIALALWSCHLPGGLNADHCIIPMLTIKQSTVGVSYDAGDEIAVSLVGARIGGKLSLFGSSLTNEKGCALLADGVIIGGDAFLTRISVIANGDHAGVHLNGAQIGGSLSLGGASVTNEQGPALVAERARIGGGAVFNDGFTASGRADQGAVSLSGAEISGQLLMSTATLNNDLGPALNADDLRTGGLVSLDGGFSATGWGSYATLRFLGCEIGQLVMTGARLTNTTGPALNADRAIIRDGAILGDGFTASGDGHLGTVRLQGAHIGGQLVLTGANLINATGPALHADSVTVDGNVLLHGGFFSTSHGEHATVNLSNTAISGQLAMRGAKFTNLAGPALDAQNISIGETAILDEGFTASGRGDRPSVNLSFARIRGKLILRNAQLINPVGPALDAQHMSIDGDAILDEDFAARGQGNHTVSMRDVHIAGRLVVGAAAENTANSEMKWDVDGMTYAGVPTVGFDQWLNLLRYGTPRYQPQPYQQLAAVARAAGHDREARRALISQRDDQLQRGNLAPATRAWTRFSKVALGYGYQPWRALIGVAGVLLVALLLAFFIPGALATTVGRPCTGVEVFQIAVDLAIPLVSTSAGTSCHVTTTAGGQLLAWAGVFISIFGWALTALFAAGFTSAIRKP